MERQNDGSLTRRFQLAMLVAVGALGAGVALTSNAPIVSSEGEPRTVKVEYGDLNLGSQEGKDVLSRRIRRAVDLVCTESDSRMLTLWVEYRKCMQNATDSAWSQIRWPQQSARVDGK
jgi:UrcA family protein